MAQLKETTINGNLHLKGEDAKIYINDIEFQGGGGGGGVSVQPDWNATNAANGAIKNKPPIKKGMEENADTAIQQTLHREVFTVANKNINNNANVKKDNNGNIASGAFGAYSSVFGGSAQAKGKRSQASGSNTVALGDYSHTEGNETFTLSSNAHAEGLLTSAIGGASHAEGDSTFAKGYASHAEGYKSSTEGMYSHAEGNSTAKGGSSHAEGYDTTSEGANSHSEGENSTTGENARAAHAEGSGTQATNVASHAEGLSTQSTGTASHAEGSGAQATNTGAHAEGVNTEATQIASHAEGQSTDAFGESSHAEGGFTRAQGQCSHAEGNTTIAEGGNAHAEGKYTHALGDSAHAEGYSSKVSGIQAAGQGSHAGGAIYIESSGLSNHILARGVGSFAHGYISQDGLIEASGNGSIALGAVMLGGQMKASGDGSLVGGQAVLSPNCLSSGDGSFAWGVGNPSCHGVKATGTASTTFGYGTQALSNYQFVHGSGNLLDSTDTYLHIVGNGSNESSRSNAYTLTYQGAGVFAQSVGSSTGADYAEYFEWLDGNPNNEDRVGLLVTLNGEQIELANPNDDILGIVSANPAVIGDIQEWQWQGKYLTDDFGRVQYEEIEQFVDAIVTNEDTGEVTIEKKSLGLFKQPIINPNYDASQEYVNRANRPEWDAIGMFGKLYLRDDGTCIPNFYATVGENGVATSSLEKTNMRVLSRVNDNIVRVLLK